MAIILIIQSGNSIDPKLKQTYERLQRGLKDEWNIDILDGKSSFVLDLFEYKFRPLLNEYTDGKIGVKDIAVALQEYSERAENFRSLFNYAQDRYKVCLLDEPYCNVFKHNTESATAEMQKMMQQGKSLEHCYRYLLHEAARTQTSSNTSAKPN